MWKGKNKSRTARPEAAAKHESSKKVMEAPLQQPESTPKTSTEMENDQPLREPEEQIEENKEKREQSLLRRAKRATYLLPTMNAGEDISALARSFIFYSIYTVLALIITNEFQEVAYDYYSTILSHEITDTKFTSALGHQKTFRDIQRPQEIWEFFDDVIYKIIYSDDPEREQKYAGKSKLFLTENRIAGPLQLRQLRVRKGTCSTAMMFADSYGACYGYYSAESELKSFDTGIGSPWKYSLDDSKAVWSGKISNYGPGGYSFNITRDPNFTREWLKDLQKNAWIRKDTRVLIMDTAIYSPNINLICVIKLVFEIHPCGAVIPTSYFYASKMFGHVRLWDFFIFSCEIMFTILTAFLVFHVGKTICTTRTSYFKNSSNLLDLLLAASAITTIVVDNLLVAVRNKSGEEFTEHLFTSIHVSFDRVLILNTYFQTATALLIFFLALKSIAFARLNKYTNFVCSSIARIKSELIAVIIMISIIIIGFSLLSLLMFGHALEQFSTFEQSLFALTSVFTDGFNFLQFTLLEAKAEGYVFFSVYIFFVKMLCVGTIVALIVYGFYKTSQDSLMIMEGDYLEDAARHVVIKLLTSIGKRRAAQRLKVSRDKSQNKTRYDALCRIFVLRNWSKLEIRLLMKRNNLNRGDPLNIDKMATIYNDFCLRNQLLMEVNAHAELMADLEEVQRSIEYCSATIVDVTAKTDILADLLLGRNPDNRAKMSK